MVHWNDWRGATSMKRKVYIETSIPSFYYEVRTDPKMVAPYSSKREP